MADTSQYLLLLNCMCAAWSQRQERGDVDWTTSLLEIEKKSKSTYKKFLVTDTSGGYWRFD